MKSSIRSFGLGAALAAITLAGPVAVRSSDIEVLPAIQERTPSITLGSWDLTTTAENDVLFNLGVGATAANVGDAVHLEVVCVDCRTWGRAVVSTGGVAKDDNLIGDIVQFFENPVDAILGAFDLDLKIEFEEVGGHFEFEILAADTVSYSIPIFTSETLPGVAISEEVSLGLVVAVDLVFSLTEEIDVDAGFEFSFPEGAYITVDPLTGDIIDQSFAGGSVDNLPITVTSGSATFKAALRVRIQTGTTIVLFGTGFDFELGVFADLIEYVATIGFPDECELYITESVDVNIGAFARVVIEIDYHNFGVSPTVVTTLLDIPLPSLCLTRPVASPTLPFSASATATVSSYSLGYSPVPYPANSDAYPVDSYPTYSDSYPANPAPTYSDSYPVGPYPTYSDSYPTGPYPTSDSYPVDTYPTYSDSYPVDPYPTYSDSYPAGPNPTSSSSPVDTYPSYSDSYPVGPYPTYSESYPVDATPTYSDSYSAFDPYPTKAYDTHSYSVSDSASNSASVPESISKSSGPVSETDPASYTSYQHYTLSFSASGNSSASAPLTTPPYPTSTSKAISSGIITTPASLTTSTVYGTSTYTITSCSAKVLHCPASSQSEYVVTKTKVLYTTICPVGQAQPAVAPSSASNSAGVHTSSITVLPIPLTPYSTPVISTVYNTTYITPTYTVPTATSFAVPFPDYTTIFAATSTSFETSAPVSTLVYSTPVQYVSVNNGTAYGTGYPSGTVGTVKPYPTGPAKPSGPVFAGAAGKSVVVSFGALGIMVVSLMLLL